MRPARLGRHPEDVERAVLVGVFGVGALRLLGYELGVMLLESVGDVLEKDQAEDNVLVLGGVHAAAQRIGHLPELGFVADRGTIRGFIRFLFCHDASQFLLPHSPIGINGLFCLKELKLMRKI